MLFTYSTTSRLYFVVVFSYLSAKLIWDTITKDYTYKSVFLQAFLYCKFTNACCPNKGDVWAFLNNCQDQRRWTWFILFFFLFFIFIFYFIFDLFFHFLFLEQLGLGLIGHTVTSVTIGWHSHKMDHET